MLHSFPVHAPEFSALVATETPSSEAGRNDDKMPLNFVCQYLSCVKGFLTHRKLLRHGANGFTFPPKEVVLLIFIDPKNPSISAGFESAKLGPMASTITTT
jgi:hypothetical protein